MAIVQQCGSLLILFLLITQVTACTLFQDLARPTICFVLPDAYRGAFQLVLDETGGADVSARDGKYFYEIPASGVLKVKTFKPFEGYHKEIAVYKNGQEIPSENSNSPPELIALRLLGTSRHNDGPLKQTNVIGNKEEAKQAQIDLMAGNLKLGKP